MNLVVIPPHGDVTLAADVAPRWDRLDAGRAFAERVADVGEVARLLDAPRAVPLDAELRLLGRAAADVLARRPPPGARLAALGAALRAGSGPPSGVRLRLDDLELAEGTTESSSDVARASLQAAPYDHELSRAADVARRATRVCLLVERDQQLPAALSLARALRPRAVEVAGSFADENWNVLRRLDALAAATLVSTPVRGWRVELPWESATTGLAWRERPSDPVPQEPWGGRVRLADVADAARLASARCRLAILGVAGGGSEAVVDEDGSSVRVSDLAAGVAALREDGVALVAEYQNMKVLLAERPEIVLRAEEAMRRAGITPRRGRARGRTDGAVLTARGLPTPNLFSGANAIHTRREWVCVEDMAAAVSTLVHLAAVWADSD